MEAAGEATDKILWGVFNTIRLQRVDKILTPYACLHAIEYLNRDVHYSRFRSDKCIDNDTLGKGAGEAEPKPPKKELWAHHDVNSQGGYLQ